MRQFLFQRLLLLSVRPLLSRSTILFGFELFPCPNRFTPYRPFEGSRASLNILSPTAAQIFRERQGKMHAAAGFAVACNEAGLTLNRFSERKLFLNCFSG